MKTDLRDVTFLLPIRLDSVVRLENLILSAKFLVRNFDTNIHILHADGYDNGVIKKVIHKSIKYTFIEDYDEVFYRTKYLNMMIEEATTPIVAVWDVDVIIPVSQIVESAEDIRNGCDVSYPYDGHTYDTSFIIRQEYLKTNRMNTLVQNTEKMSLIYGDDTKGGAFLVNKESYIKSGKENENFYGWGPEDYERYARWTNLEYKINRVKGNLYHLTHSRGGNSSYRSNQQMISTNREYHIIRNSCKEEIFRRMEKNII